MLYIISIILLAAIGGYFIFRYFLLLYAFKETAKEINDIQQDLTQNHILHLPIPDRHFGNLLSSLNAILEEIRKERQTYEKNEKEFQQQIENISHDLRTPLTVILGYLKLIKKSGINGMMYDKELSKKSASNEMYDKELMETIEMIERKAETMKSLVTQFYDFSRLHAGDYELPLNNIDISRTLRESLMGNYQILEHTHLNINADIPNYPLWVMGEESALERIFLNLLQNAGRYADTYLHIQVKEWKKTVSVFFVNDTRILSEEDIPHLFERFYMQDNSRNQGGTGLGLTVAKSLAEEMGAELNVSILNKNPEKNLFTLSFELRMILLSHSHK